MYPATYIDRIINIMEHPYLPETTKACSIQPRLPVYLTHMCQPFAGESMR